jgi:integrase
MATITKLPSGKFRAQVRVKGQYQGRTFVRKTDAKAWATATEAALASRAATGVVPPGSITVMEVIEAYLQQANLHGNTAPTLRRLGKTIGNVPVGELKVAHLQAYVDLRLAEGVKGATMARGLSLLGGALNWARYTRGLDVNPELPKEMRKSLAAARVDMTSSERDRYITDTELELMRATFRAQKALVLPMVDIMNFALATAMRRGEIVGLLHEDLDAEARTVIIRDRKDPKRKIGNHQTVPLSTAALAIIAKQPTAAGRIFPFTGQSVSAAWILARDRAGITDATFHDLRHRAITDLFAKGLTIPQVSLMSGHKTWEQLRRYTQIQATSFVNQLG